MSSNQIVYFNNCRNRRHADIFSENDAFFDLNTTGLQSTKAMDLPVGQECVVATKVEGDRLLFSWYTLHTEKLIKDDSGTSCRVFLGHFNASEEMTKRKAVRSKRYSAFFNNQGSFKRQSVAYGEVLPRYRLGVSGKRPTASADEVDLAGKTFPEGAVRTVSINAYERSASARAKCLQHHGTSCAVCGMSFAEVYGSAAADYIHVHHLKPMSELKKSYRVNPVKDLIPVCPNCHAVIHLGGQVRTIKQVRKLIAKATG
jgi:hypothetical protein